MKKNSEDIKTNEERFVEMAYKDLDGKRSRAEDTIEEAFGTSNYSEGLGYMISQFVLGCRASEIEMISSASCSKSREEIE